MNRYIPAVAVALAFTACSGGRGTSTVDTTKVLSVKELPPVDGQAVLDRVKVLASDEFEGRAPGSRGEELTVKYVAGEFQKLGLQPGNTDGTYTQGVPLVGMTVEPGAALTFKAGAQERTLKMPDDFVAWTKHVVESTGIDNSELVFVGYGVQAPEYQWDDFKGVDVRGKTLLVLVNDPPVPDPADPASLDPRTFGGNAMTYYGRWTYKYEIGAQKGAAAVLIVHETGPAGYPFAVVQMNAAEKFDLRAPDNNMGRANIEGWLGLEQAKQLLAMAGQDFDTLKKQAVSREFKPVPLGATASITLHNTLRTLDSRNVVAKLEGSDPALRNEYVIYCAHWDHFGVGAEVDGDRIYNGAVDNATGVAGLIEIARAFTALPAPPKRSILFLAVTAEEQGLLGSGYYAAAPIYPLAKTLGVVNMDGLNVYGRTRDITVVGLGNSDLDDYAAAVAAEQGRGIKPDAEPEKGFYYRSDHFPFAKEGVPALSAGAGLDYVDQPPDYGRKVRDDYTQRHYHKPSDEVRDDWRLDGLVEDLQFYFAVGYRVSQAEEYPEWKPGTEFRAKREAQLKGPNQEP